MDEDDAFLATLGDERVALLDVLEQVLLLVVQQVHILVHEFLFVTIVNTISKLK
jgi:hypothetical protein